MITIALCDRDADVVRNIRSVLSAYSVRHSWANCRVSVIRTILELDQLQDTPDILISDMANPQMVERIKSYKAEFPATRVFPIAGPEIPPTTYVCPEIMPCGLFWRPVTAESAVPVVEQMMAMVHAQTVQPSQSNFRISGKQKVQEIPYNAILYFEAREKKLTLRLQNQEMSFSGTLSSLEEELPPEFIRCHKSFIINRRHILSVDRSNGSVVLDNRMEVPISRSYKKAFWEAYQDEK